MDQADIYGDCISEELLGNTFFKSPGLRNQLEIVTKCDIKLPLPAFPERRVKSYDTSRDYITESVERSLKKMRIDVIDLLLLHRPDPLLDHFETGAVLDELVLSGKVRSVGVSNFKPWDWDLLQSAMTIKLQVNQIEVSILHHYPFTNGDISFHQKKGVPVMAWSPLSGGNLFLSEDSRIQNLVSLLDSIAKNFNTNSSVIALAWLLYHPSNILPVIGTNNLNRLRTVGQVLDVKLDRETWFEIYQAALGHEIP